MNRFKIYVYGLLECIHVINKNPEQEPHINHVNEIKYYGEK